MELEYFDMLSGSPIEVANAGHVRSPKLKEIGSAGIGVKSYNLYLNFLSWDKADLIHYIELVGYSNLSKYDNNVLMFFDICTLIDISRELCCEVLSFFLTENLSWDATHRRFITYGGTSILDDQSNVVGYIDRDNFSEVRNVILKMNYISKQLTETKDIKFVGENTEALWNKVQSYLHKQKEAKTKQEIDPSNEIGNLISKLCTINPAYNLLNVYELTVFQFYDQFFQSSYMRSIKLSERIYSNHGGDSFDYTNWMRPINNK